MIKNDGQSVFLNKMFASVRINYFDIKYKFSLNSSWSLVAFSSLIFSFNVFLFLITIKGVLHPRLVFGLFLHFSQKLQHIGNK